MGSCLTTAFGFGKYKKIPKPYVDATSSESLESSGYAFANPNYEEPDWDYGIYEEPSISTLPGTTNTMPIDDSFSS